tara:strand:+ start:369 stop:635 length:267 start_codon:yes stop_codon:yes gene_type:complete
MSFIGDIGTNLPDPDQVKRCQFAGSNNSKAKGGCGKHVEKIGQRVTYRKTGTFWFIWKHLDYCKDHRKLGNYAEEVKKGIKGIYVPER